MAAKTARPLPASITDRIDRLGLMAFTREWLEAVPGFRGPSDFGRNQQARGLVEFEQIAGGRWRARLTEAGEQLLERLAQEDAA